MRSDSSFLDPIASNSFNMPNGKDNLGVQILVQASDGERVFLFSKDSFGVHSLGSSLASAGAASFSGIKFAPQSTSLLALKLDSGHTNAATFEYLRKEATKLFTDGSPEIKTLDYDDSIKDQDRFDIAWRPSYGANNELSIALPNLLDYPDFARIVINYKRASGELASLELGARVGAWELILNDNNDFALVRLKATELFASADLNITKLSYAPKAPELEFTMLGNANELHGYKIALPDPSSTQVKQIVIKYYGNESSQNTLTITPDGSGGYYEHDLLNQSSKPLLSQDGHFYVSMDGNANNPREFKYSKVEVSVLDQLGNSSEHSFYVAPQPKVTNIFLGDKKASWLAGGEFLTPQGELITKVRVGAGGAVEPSLEGAEKVVLFALSQDGPLRLASGAITSKDGLDLDVSSYGLRGGC